MPDHTDFLAALSQRTDRVNELLLAPEFLERIRPAHLQELAAAYLQRGGKRLRPAVLLFCCGAVGGAEEDALPAAAAMEIFHTWTLMHDDIIDHDDLRRGGPTGHILGAKLGRSDWALDDADAADYGVSLSILAGDVQHGLCVSMFLRCPNSPAPLLLQLVADLELDMVADLVEGETLDIQMEKRPVAEVSLDEVLRMMYLKTAALYEFCAKAGAMLGLQTQDEGHPLVASLREFCGHCGAAFQLQDDILGITGDERKLGKPVGSDITEGKRTPVLLTAYQTANAAARARLDSVVGNPRATQDEVAEITDLIVGLGAVEAVAKMARRHIEDAMNSLSTIPESEYTKWLAGWAEFMVDREF